MCSLESCYVQQIIMKLKFNCKMFRAGSRPCLKLEARNPMVETRGGNCSRSGLLDAGESATEPEDQFPVVHRNAVEA